MCFKISDRLALISPVKYINLLLFNVLILFLSASTANAQTAMSGKMIVVDSLSHNMLLSDSTIHLRSDSLGLTSGTSTLFAQPINNRAWYRPSYKMELSFRPYERTIGAFNADSTFKLSQSFKSFRLEEIAAYSSVLPQEITWDEYKRPVLIISSIAANWLSFHLKRKADIFYNQYQQSSSLTRMDHYYEKAARYDRYSTIMLGVSLSTLTIYIYDLVFTE